jgi:molybdopterin-guanine dinucleotide biosynthesis protein A
MNDAGLEMAECSRLPVFRLIGGDGVTDRDFGRALVGELAGRGMRLLIVRFPSGGGPTAASFPSHMAAWATMADGFDGGGRSRIACFEAAECRHAMPLLTDLARHYTIVMVDGDCGLPLNTLRLAAKAEPATGDEASVNLRTADPRQGVAACAELLLSWLEEVWQMAPVWACVLIGGRSSRMGRPKHLLEKSDGRTWLEDTVEVLRPHVERVVLAGQGEIPSSLRDLTRIADVPGVIGPLAGILAAMRWQPDVTWLLVACDMPSLTSPAVQWLLDRRRPGRWAVIPRRSADSHVEPLFACYDRRCRTLFEELRCSGSLKIGIIAHNVNVYRPVIPEAYLQAWDNINTPSEFEQYHDGRGTNRGRPGRRNP